MSVFHSRQTPGPACQQTPARGRGGGGDRRARVRRRRVSMVDRASIPFGNAQVGPQANGAVLLPTNQWISPFGSRILDTPERLISSSMSPSGKYLAALGWNDFPGNLTIVDVQTGPMVQSMPFDTGSGTADTIRTLGRPRWALLSADGTTLWVRSRRICWVHGRPATERPQSAEIPLCGAAMTSPICDPYIAP